MVGWLQIWKVRSAGPLMRLIAEMAGY